MIEGYTCFLNTDKVSGTVETLKSIDSCLSNKDLKESFYEMEELLNKYTFEHGSFSTTYKETLDMIETEITKITKDIYNLSYGVEQTSQVLSGEKEKTVRDVQELSNVYGRGIGVGVPSNLPISVLKEGKSDIAEVITTGIQPEQQPTSHEINTVPIGIGIGVAGAVGAIGAIAYDSIRGKERVKIDDYKPSREETQQRELYQPPRETSEDVFDDPTPYFALRDRQTINKFYSDNDNHREQ